MNKCFLFFNNCLGDHKSVLSTRCLFLSLWSDLSSADVKTSQINRGRCVRAGWCEFFCCSACSETFNWASSESWRSGPARYLVPPGICAWIGAGWAMSGRCQWVQWELKSCLINEHLKLGPQRLHFHTQRCLFFFFLCSSLQREQSHRVLSLSKHCILEMEGQGGLMRYSWELSAESPVF